MNENTHATIGNSNPAASGASVETMDRIAKSAHKGIDTASKAAHPTIDRAAAGAHKAVESADQTFHSAAEALDRAGAKGEELVTTSTTYMREHPLLSLGIAVTAGYLLSRLLTPRQRCQSEQ